MIFGCIHIAWKHKKATEHVVEQFRKYHPNNPYTLISDNGFDYSELAKKIIYPFIGNFWYFSTNLSGASIGQWTV